MPPMTTVASGRCTSLPMPVLNAIGTNPKAVTSAVINTGLSRVNAPCRIAASSDVPRPCNSLMNVTITNPLSTAIPDSAMKPTAAEIEKGIPRIHRDNTPPVKANGTPEKMIAASLAEPYAKYNRLPMMSNVSGTTTASRLDADSSCSNVPPYSIQ